MPARLLFTAMDLLYGRQRTLSKFKMLELARVSYQSWEQVAYVAVTHVHRDPGFARLELRYGMRTHPLPPALRGTINDAESSHRPVARWGCTSDLPVTKIIFAARQLR